RDMGAILGCFGHVSALRRLAVGYFTEESAIPLDEFEKMVLSSGTDRYLQPVEAVLDDIPALDLTDAEIDRIRQGQTIRLLSRHDADRLTAAGIGGDEDTVLAMGLGKPLAILRKDGVDLHPVRVFNL